MTPASFVLRNLGLMIALVGAIAWAVWYGLRLDSGDSPNEALARARAELSTCLLGRSSVEPWAIEHRLRGIHVAARNDASADDWPMRCAAHAEALERLLEADGVEPRGVSDRLRAGELYEDLRVAPDIVEIFRHDDERELSSSVAQPPPPPAELMRELAPWPHGPSRATSGTSTLALLLDRAVCRFRATPSGLEPEARCAFLPDRSRDESRVHGLVAGSGHEQVLLTRDGPISSTTGERILSSISPHTVAPLGEGAFVGLSSDALLVREASGAERRLVLDRPRGVAAETAALVGDHLSWVEDGTLYVRALAADTLGPIVEIGRPPVHSVPFIGPDASCAHGEVLASWIESDPTASPRGSEYRVVARVDGTWVFSGPLHGRLDCLPDAVVVTNLRGDSGGMTISRTDCTARGCSTNTVFLPDLTGQAAAAPLGDRMVLVWADDLVRARIAPVSELPNAPTLPLLDAVGDQRHYEYLGQSFVRHLKLHVRGDSAIVESTADDTVGIHLSADATIRPVLVSYE